MNEEFTLENGQFVTFDLTGKRGQVIGRAQYLRSQVSYLIEYVDGHGDVATDWKLASEITANGSVVDPAAS